jgi:YfiH family protein
MGIISDSFFWTREPWGRALRAGPLLEVADHFYTTRDLNLEPTGSGWQEGWGPLAASIGASPDCLIRVRQVHGDAVFEADRTDSDGEPAGADALVSADPRHALSVRVADCVPLLMADPRTNLVAAVHAGWRGTAAGVAAATVRVLAARGADPADLIVALGPSIGPCCYEVGESLVAAFQGAGTIEQVNRWFTRQDATLKLDLLAANRDQLAAAGVRAGNIHTAGMCTACHPDLFHSFRRDGQQAGRLAAVIRSGRSRGARPNPSLRSPAGRLPD